MPSTKLQTDLSSLITTGLDESQIGDVLLFISPESEGYQDTRIVSAFSHTTYYTITADANGFNTNVYRGDAKGSVFKGIFSHIVTVSRASGHRVWESNERNRWESKEGEEGSELDEKVDIEDKEVHPQESEEGGRKHRRTSSNAQLGGANTLSLGIQSQNDVFLIEYGKGASKALRECVKIEKGTVTIKSGNTIYGWRLQDGHPALYAVTSCESRQVIWTRPPHINATPTTRSTFPAMLTFYPETRPILDAVIIALIIWERRAKTEFEPNVK